MTVNYESMKQFKFVWDCWEHHASNTPDAEAIVHWDSLNGHFRWTCGCLYQSAMRIAACLLRHGVCAGDVCALIIRHHKDFYPLYMGISLAGAVPAVLAYPNERLHPEKFLQGLTGIAQTSGLDWVLTEKDLEQTVAPLLASLKTFIKGIFCPLEWATPEQLSEIDNGTLKEHRRSLCDSKPFLLQHSSGTTGLQKAVTLSHHAVLEHVVRYAEAIQMSANDKVVNWLPLYHDMGLIAAFHLPLALGVPSVQIDPFQWVCAPAIFLQAISKERATLAWLPNFAYHFMADRVPDEEMEGVNLSCMRMFINCSEVVRAESHEKFFNRFCKYGIKIETLGACYAMAETTFAVTQTSPGEQAKAIEVDREALAQGKVESPRHESAVRKCVSSGRPVSGCSIKVMDEQGRKLRENEVGRIVIQSVSLFDGYRNQPMKTRAVFQNGWYLSGDIGFCRDGEYFIIGREDDVIVVAGRNIFPEDVEDAVSKVKGVIPGRAVAFGVDNDGTGTQDVWLAAETHCNTQEEKAAFILGIKKAGMDIDVTISSVCLVPPRWLIKSSSGKLSRKTNKERLLQKTVKGIS